jgi:hypothetical protein
MTSKADGVNNAIRSAVRGSEAGLRMNELGLSVSVSDEEDVFAEVSIDRERDRRKIVHIATAAVRGVLRATDTTEQAHGDDGGFAEQATDGEATVAVVSDRIYRVSVEDEWRGLPDAKLSARVTAAIEAV